MRCMHAYLSLRFWKNRCKDLLLAMGIPACPTEQERPLFHCPFHFPKHASTDIVTCTKLTVTFASLIIHLFQLIFSTK